MAAGPQAAAACSPQQSQAGERLRGLQRQAGEPRRGLQRQAEPSLSHQRRQAGERLPASSATSPATGWQLVRPEALPASTPAGRGLCGRLIVPSEWQRLLGQRPCSLQRQPGPSPS